MVIAILGVLVAIAVPRLSGFAQRGEEQAAAATARTLNSATTIFEADGNTLTAGTTSGQLISALVSGGFLLEEPDDLSNVTYNESSFTWDSN